jgi:hypothetical protein
MNFGFFFGKAADTLTEQPLALSRAIQIIF